MFRPFRLALVVLGLGVAVVSAFLVIRRLAAPEEAPGSRAATAPRKAWPARTCSATSVVRPEIRLESEAQQFFDEGLTLLYGFNHDEAFRSFERRPPSTRSADAALGHGACARDQLQRRAPADRIAQAYTHLAPAQKRAPNGSDAEQATHRRAGEALRRQPERRSSGARAGVLGGDGRGREALSGRSGCGHAVRRKPDEPAAVAALRQGRDAGARHRDDRGDARARHAAQPEPPWRESLLHPRRRSVEEARARARRRPSGWRRWCPAPATSSTCRRTSTSAPGSTSVSAKSNAAAARVDEQYFKKAGAGGDVPVHVLRPQPAVRIGGRDVRGAICSSP